MKISKDWAPFEARLAAVLGVLEEDHYLILAHPGTGHYVQFAPEGPYGLRAEARSNAFIPPRHQLGSDLELRLIELGWEAPTHQPGAEDTDPDGSPNWFRQWPAPVAWAEASQVAAMTLREVYGVRHPARLRYHAFHSQGTPILLPTLGIRREDQRGLTQPVWPTSIDQLREVMERGILPLPPGYFFTRLDGGELLTEGPGGFVAVAAREAPFRVLFYSRLLEDLDGSPALLEALNERNAALLVGRLYWQDGCVMVDHAIPAVPFVPEHFRRVLGEMHVLTPRLARELHQSNGGTLLANTVADT